MPDVDLIVVGAGIVGSTAADSARKRGFEVLHVAAPEQPSSLAAAAVTRPSYIPPVHRPALREQIRRYANTPALAQTGALVTSWRTPQASPKPQGGWWLIDPAAPLIKPDLSAVVTEVHPAPAGGNPGVSTDSGQRVTARAVLLATGARSTLNPAPQTGKVTWGVTWIGPVEALTRPSVLRVHHWAPYKALTAGRAGDLARVGSSSATNPELATKRGNDLLTLALEAGLISTTRGFVPRLGARYKTTETILHPWRGVWWVGGHHRNGYALGPVDARRAVTLALGGEQ